jgi:tetratricopeptide (TPR) repeat protein
VYDLVKIAAIYERNTMRLLVLTIWLLLPLGFYAWHMGPGQHHQAVDQAGSAIALGQKLASENDHAGAVVAFSDALQKLPVERKAESYKLRLERAKSQMLAKQLPEAHEDLKRLVEQLQADPQADEKLLSEAHSTTANSQYYLTWLMRVEGMGREDWEPEIDSARATYKLLAEQAVERGDTTSARKHQEDLESAIRLARMDLGELTGLPLPSQ